ncbi:MAG: hypothetical protein ACN4GW_15445 [Desulforhopalus sp.]
MKAFGYIESMPISKPDSLQDIELDQPHEELESGKAVGKIVLEGF